MTTQQTYNPAGVDLAVAALAQIEMHPETWNQRDWRCTTGMCLAGTMADLSPEVEWRNRSPHDSILRLDAGAGPDVAAGDWACEQIFGLPYWSGEPGSPQHPEASTLFSSGNSIEDLRAGVKALCNGESVHDAIERDRAERAK